MGCKTNDMEPKRRTREELLQDYLEKYEGYGLNSIAKALAAHYPDEFKNSECARNALRRRVGSFGKAERKRRGQTKSSHDGKKHQQNPFGLPFGDSNDYSHYKVKPKNMDVMVLADAHVPFHRTDALTTVIQRGKKLKPELLILNGDWLDCHRLSRFNKEPGTRNFKGELKVLREVLDKVTNEISPREVVYKQGNHEERYQSYMSARAPELLELEKHVAFEDIVGFDLLGIEYVDDRRIIEVGHLNIIHGHEYRSSPFSPVNPAKAYYTKAKSNILVAHHHRSSQHTDKDIRDAIQSAWSMGCLCDLSPAYMPKNDWNLGFVEIELEKSGDFRLRNKGIFDGKIL